MTRVLTGPWWLLVIAGMAFSCCSSQDARRQDSAASSGSPEAQPAGPAAHEGTALKGNSVRIDALIDSVDTLAGEDYRLHIRIISAQFVEGMEGLEHDAPLQVSPQYVRTADGVLDATDERNNALLSLRHARPGDHLRGHLSLGPGGRWVLTGVEQ